MSCSPSPSFSTLENRESKKTETSPVPKKKRVGEKSKPDLPDDIFQMDSLDDSKSKNSLLEFMSSGGHKQIPVSYNSNQQYPFMHTHLYQGHPNYVEPHHLHSLDRPSSPQMPLFPSPMPNQHPSGSRKQELDSMSKNLKNILGL